MKAWNKSLAAMVVLFSAFVAGYLGMELSQNQQFARAEAQVKDAREQQATAVDLSSSFKNVGHIVGPSVVNINVRKSVKVPRGPGLDDDIRRFFHEHGGNNDEQDDSDQPDNPGPGDQSFEQIGTGSGVIMEAADGKGYILTNNHVAGGAEEMIIVLSDGRRITNGKLVGADAKTDLAVVRIDADRLIAAQWGDSDKLQQGDWVMAFGSPFGYVGSMTHGIVSALNRYNVGILGAQGYEDFIQVDAPINPGNSGGPLVNLQGEVVGVNTAIATRSGGFQGIGFAIPSNQAKTIYQTLKEKGKVVRGWLGIQIQDVAVARAREELVSDYKGDNGVVVEGTFANTPATNKLQAGDIITAINDKQLKDTQELRNIVAQLPPKTDVKLQVYRDGKMQEQTVTLGEQPEGDAMAALGQRGGGQLPGGRNEASVDALGFRVSNITDELRDKYNLGSLKGGAVIVQVAPRSPAAREGLEAGDVVTKFGNKAVNSADDLLSDLKGADLKKGVQMKVISRDGASRLVFIKTGNR